MTRQVFVTRYALTDGVVRRNVIKTYSTGSVVVEGLEFAILYEGKDYQGTEEAALKQADQMRLKKIAALRKQIEKLEKLQFAVKEPK